jgi:hypothetical protein
MKMAIVMTIALSAMLAPVEPRAEALGGKEGAQKSFVQGTVTEAGPVCFPGDPCRPSGGGLRMK